MISSSSQTASADHRLAPRHDWIWHVAALVIAPALACLQIWPVVTEISSRAPGWPGGNIAYIRLIDWLKEAQGTHNAVLPPALALTGNHVTGL